MVFCYTSLKVVSLRRLSSALLFFNFLALCSLRCTANDALFALWDIQGPDWKICDSEGENDILGSDSTINSTTCDNSSSVIRLDYTISKDTDIAMYRIFQKECEEEFEVGTQPILGSISPDDDGRIRLSKSAPSDGDRTATASLEILLAEGSLTSSWWRRLTASEEEEQTIEFCIRMGLWLPPQAGDMEVNFRETNVAVIFKKEADGEGDGYVARSVVLNPKELVTVKVTLPGSDGGKKKEEKDPPAEDSEEKKDEL